MELQTNLTNWSTRKVQNTAVSDPAYQWSDSLAFLVPSLCFLGDLDPSIPRENIFSKKWVGETVFPHPLPRSETGNGHPLIFQFGQIGQSGQNRSRVTISITTSDFEMTFTIVIERQALHHNSCTNMFLTMILQIELLQISFSTMRLLLETFIFLFKWHISGYCSQT